MSLNDLLQRAAGVRLVRVRDLEALGVNNIRRATMNFHSRAFAAVRVMEEHNGKSLTQDLKRKANDYAMTVLGSLDYAPWLYVYTTMQGVFREGWMPDNFYHLVVVPRITKGLVEIGSMKSFSNVILKTDALPDLAYHIEGIFYDRDFNIIDRHRLCELARPFGQVFIKRDGSGNGVGIAKIPVKDLMVHEFGQDCVVQRPIRQHPFFDEMVRGSVTTLRVTTARAPDGTVSVRNANLRVGRAVNEWVRSDDQLQIGISDEGVLDETAYLPDWRACTAHPDTGFVFADVQVPQFDKATKLCLSLHAKLPHVPVIGWDLAVNTEEEIELIEWNGGYSGIKFSEAVSGPHYRDMGWERFAGKAGVNDRGKL